MNRINKSIQFDKDQKQPPEVFYEKGVLRNFACNFFKKETLAQVLSCEFCEIS